MITEEIHLLESSKEYVLAENIFNNNDVPLIKEGTLITPHIKDKLLGMGILSVKVYSPSDILGENYNKALNLLKESIYDLCIGKKIKYEKILELTNIIYVNFNDNEDIVSCLNKIQKKDEYTHTHCLNTGIYSMLIAKWMGLSDIEIKKAAQSGLLHDIGKIKISKKILNKKGKLNDEEYDIIKKHTIYGHEMLSFIRGIDEDIKQAVLLHHERMDCSGYPYNAEGNCVNLFAKIVAVADVYDAMTSDRIYQKRRTPFEVFLAFKTDGFSMFDTTVLETFMKNIIYCYSGGHVLLSNGKMGQVIYIPFQSPWYPIVKIDRDYIDLAENNHIKVEQML